jgi:hypothetical protein
MDACAVSTEQNVSSRLLRTLGFVGVIAAIVCAVLLAVAAVMTALSPLMSEKAAGISIVALTGLFVIGLLAWWASE